MKSFEGTMLTVTDNSIEHSWISYFGDENFKHSWWCSASLDDSLCIQADSIRMNSIPLKGNLIPGCIKGYGSMPPDESFPFNHETRTWKVFSLSDDLLFDYNDHIYMPSVTGLSYPTELSPDHDLTIHWETKHADSCWVTLGPYFKAFGADINSCTFTNEELSQFVCGPFEFQLKVFSKDKFTADGYPIAILRVHNYQRKIILNPE